MSTKVLFFSLLLALLFLQEALPEEGSLITITPQSFTKIVIRVPPFTGESEEEASSLLRKLLDYHLFCVALKEPPLQGFKERAYYLKGALRKEGFRFFFQGELQDLFENKTLKLYKIEATSLERLTYALSDQIIKDISPYQGVAQTRLTFVKRTPKGDSLYLMDFSKRNLKQIRSAELILFPKFSPSGKKLAYLVYEKGTFHLEIYTLPTGEFQAFHLSGLSSTPLWAPDERNLYLTLGKGGEINIYKFSLEDKKLLPLTTGKGVHQAGSVSPDGKWLAYVGDLSGKPQIYLLDLEKGTSKRVSFEGKYHSSPRFSPQGNLLLYLVSQGSQNQLILYNLKNGEKKRLSLSGLSITDPAFSTSGNYLIFQSKKKGIQLLHLDSLLTFNYLPYQNLYYPDWGRLY